MEYPQKIPINSFYKRVWDTVFESCSFIEGRLIIVDDNLGIIRMNIGINWIHICNPSLIYNNSNFPVGTKIIVDNSPLNRMECSFCKNCNYPLTKQEQVLLKLYLLGEKR